MDLKARLRRLIKPARKAKEIKVHPQNKKFIKYVFTLNGTSYYQFLHDYEIPKQRFTFLQQFYQEMQFKCTKEYLKEFCEASKKYINEGNLGQAYKLVDELDYRLDWSFEPDSLLRFASALYFDLKEDIFDYDITYNKKKIERFKKKEIFMMLLKELIGEQNPLLSLSKRDMDIYLQELNEKLKSQLRALQKAKGKRKSITATT